MWNIRSGSADALCRGDAIRQGGRIPGHPGHVGRATESERRERAAAAASREKDRVEAVVAGFFWWQRRRTICFAVGKAAKACSVSTF